MKDRVFPYAVYMLRCSDNSLYTGVTNDVERRVGEHAEGVDPSCYTSKRRPIELVYAVHFREITEAIAFEKQIKRWSRRKKEALINGNQEMLERLSVNGMVRIILDIHELTHKKIWSCVMVSTDEP